MPKTPKNTAKTLAQRLTDAKTAGWADWIRSEADEKAVLADHWFDASAGVHICAFFDQFIRHSDGVKAGRPFRLTPWQRTDLLMPLFGWRRANGQRRYTSGDVFVAKKNGKSTIAAGIANYFLLTGGPRTRCYGAAYTREQAGIIYEEAAAMVRASPELAKRLRPIDSRKRIALEANGSFYQALAGEAASAEGYIPTLVLFDEIHVQKDRKLYAALVYGGLASEDALFLSVSTVGVADLTSIWWEQYELAQAIIAGTVTDHSRFALIFQADEECRHDPEKRADPEQWRKACPNLGITIEESKYKEHVAAAEASPRKLGDLLRYMFDLPTAAISKVVPIDKWRKCAVEAPDMTGQPCYLGLDLASHEDLAALAAVFPREGGKPLLRFWAWCPEERILQRERRRMAFYREWVDAGHLLMTSGNRIDHNAIFAKVCEICEDCRVHELGFDPWNADAVINPLMESGIVDVAQVQQTFAGMTAGTKGLLSAIEECELEHDGNPVAEWCLANAAAAQKEGKPKEADDDFEEGSAIRFDKEKSSDKIDLAVAAAIAWGRMIAAAEVPSPVIW